MSPLRGPEFRSNLKQSETRLPRYSLWFTSELVDGLLLTGNSPPTQRDMKALALTP